MWSRGPAKAPREAVAVAHEQSSQDCHLAEMDAMTPQQRADLIAASVVRSWDEVDPAFREQALEAARVLNAQ